MFISKAGKSHINKFSASLVCFQQLSLSCFLRYLPWLANSYLLCAMPHRPVSVSVSVSKPFKTFLGLCHPLWIRRSWCLRATCPCFVPPSSLTCTILLSLGTWLVFSLSQSATLPRAFPEEFEVTFFFVFLKYLIIIRFIRNYPAYWSWSLSVQLVLWGLLTKSFLHFLSPHTVVKARPLTSNSMLPLPASSSGCSGQRHWCSGVQTACSCWWKWHF